MQSDSRRAMTEDFTDYETPEWLEFKENDGYNDKELNYVNIKVSEISEIAEKTFSYPIYENGRWTKIIMKNGKEHHVNMSYKKVMELV